MRAEKEKGFGPGLGFGVVLDLAADCGQPPLSAGTICTILDTLLAAAEYVLVVAVHVARTHLGMR